MYKTYPGENLTLTFETGLVTVVTRSNIFLREDVLATGNGKRLG